MKRRLLNTNSITQQIKGFDGQREREKKSREQKIDGFKDVDVDVDVNANLP